MNIYLKTYGCQMNERDTEALAGMFAEAGHTVVDKEEKADVLLFNTCSVREQAERKAKGKLGFLKKLKMKNPDLIIGVMGCMAQRLGDELLEEIPHLDFVLGTGRLHTLVPLVESLRQERRRLADIAESAEVLTGMGSHYRAPGETPVLGQIAITRGCNRFCSYCIVPYVRGREISREPGDIVEEARRLAAGGVREILLLGQNVAAYGLGGNINPPPEGVSPFADLLEALAEIPELHRIRFTSPYVTYFNDRLIGAMAANPKVCRNLHLPLQSGSNRILKAMNRQYTRGVYFEIAEKIRRAMPEITFSTDVIVGFPGETEEDFAETRELMNRMAFDNAFIFKYSPRPGAASAEWADTIPQEVKEERNRILLDDLKARVAESLKAAVGTTVEVLVEGVSPRNPARWSGKTGTARTVHFDPEPGVKPGDLVEVVIERAGAVSLSGKIKK